MRAVNPDPPLPPTPTPTTRRMDSIGATDTRGKHLLQAQLKRLQQEARYLEEELEQLEKMEKASAACKGILYYVETEPDPLLPVTNGPINQSWDQWFEGPQDSKHCCCWIF